MMRLFLLFKNVGNSLKDIGILKVLLPILAVVGPVVLFYFGIKGILKRETINLIRFQHRTVTESSFKITGIFAVIIGFLYLASGILIACILIPISFGLIFQ